MKDYLNNEVNVGDTVIIAVKSGKVATLTRAFVKQAVLKPQYSGGAPTNMLEIEWSNLNRFWIPARHVISLPDSMLPEKRREKLNDVEEGIQVS